MLVRPELGACIAAIAIFALFAIVAGQQGFLSVQGTINYLEVSAQLGILATAVSLLMIAGEFDLSVGSMIGAAGMVIAIPVSQFGCPLWLAIIVAFLFSLLIGYVNGWLVVKTRLPSFIITLASLYLLRGFTIGLTLLFTNFTRASGLRAYIEGDLLAIIFTGRPLGLPISIWWWIVLTIVLGWVLFKTPYGNWIFASGGDALAARNVGVPVARVKISLFMMTAASATLLAVIQVLNTGISRRAARRTKGTGIHCLRGHRWVSSHRRLWLSLRGYDRRIDPWHGSARDLLHGDQHGLVQSGIRRNAVGRRIVE